MTVKSAWMPKSERGREVARIMRAAGFDIRDQDVQGHYLCNVPGASELDVETLRLVAYTLNAEQACYDEQEAFEQAAQVLDNPARYGFSTDAEAEAEATRLRTAWFL